MIGKKIKLKKKEGCYVILDKIVVADSKVDYYNRNGLTNMSNSDETYRKLGVTAYLVMKEGSFDTSVVYIDRIERIVYE